MLKKLNFILSSFLPQKLYWHAVGLIHPWSAVLEGVSNPQKLYEESEDLVNILKKLKLINKKSIVLDIGCGVGRLEYKLANEVKKCVGVDIAPSMISLAKKNIDMENVDFIATNGKDLTDLGNQKFDLIFSIIVFQHLPRKTFKNYIHESYKHLKPGGNLFFQIPIYNTGQPSEPPAKHPWAIRSYNLNELRNLLQETGFNSIGFFDVSGKKLKYKEYQVFVLGKYSV